MAEYWLVLIGEKLFIVSHDEFVDFADRAKYESGRYEAYPLYSIHAQTGDGA